MNILIKAIKILLIKVNVTATVRVTSYFSKTVAARELGHFFPRVTVTKLLLESNLVTVPYIRKVNCINVAKMGPGGPGHPN